MKFDSRLTTIYITAAAAMIVALILAQMYWKRRLTTWAESQHLELVRFRYAWFYEGPSAWTRSRTVSPAPAVSARAIPRQHPPPAVAAR